MPRGTTYYLTGHRITSYGAPNSDHILFFHCQHTGNGAYKYGVITSLPLRRDKTVDENSPANFAKYHPEPEGFPAAPGPVT